MDQQEMAQAIAAGVDATIRRAMNLILFVVALVFAGVFMVNVARWAFWIGVDDTDASRWHRSGLRVLTDAKTGIQYLSDGKGGLVRRADK